VFFFEPPTVVRASYRGGVSEGYLPERGNHDEAATVYAMVGSLIRIGSVFLAGAILTGCSTHVPTETILTKRLADRGPVPLSADNPFIASNLLLNKEMERSPELKGFIDHRGQPATLEVERALIGPLKLKLFYADNGDRFELERVDDTWIISGPINQVTPPGTAPTVADSKVATARPSDIPPPPVAAVAAALENRSEPLKGIPESPTVVLASRIDRDSLSTDALTTAPVAGPSEVRAALRSTPFESPASAPPTLQRELPESRPEMLTRLIERSAGHSAELSPRGDVVHYVTEPHESFALLAEWYTDSPLNAPRIARMNGRQPTNKLEAGDSVVIPSYLVTNKNRLTAEAVKALHTP
jgi:hypothetical protein